MKRTGVALSLVAAIFGCQQSAPVEAETRIDESLAAVAAEDAPFTFSEADAIWGTAKLTISGAPVSLAVRPVDEVDQRTPGHTQKVEAAITLGFPEVEIASLRGIDDDVRDTLTSADATATGRAMISDVSLLGGLVRAQGLVTRASCGGSRTSNHCEGSTSLARLTIAGTDVPVTDIAPNTKLPVVGTISVPVAGVPVSLPVNLELTLNAQAGGSNGVDLGGLVVDGLRLQGAATSPLVSLEIDISVGGPYSEVETREGSTQPGFVCSLSDIENTQCMGPKDCLYPHPGDCKQFIHCEVNADGVTGRPTVKDCPADLLWNDNKKECDWPSESTCR